MQFMLELPRLKKQIIAMALDAICLPLTFMLAIWLRYEGFDYGLFSHYFWLIIGVPCVSIPLFVRLGLYRAIIRYIDQKIISVVVAGVTLSILFLAFISVMMHIIGLSRAVFMIYWAGAILYVGASRVLVKTYLVGVDRNDDATAIAIYGAGKAGVQLAAVLCASREYACVAFIDDNITLHGSSIRGIKVGAPSKLPELIRRFNIKEVWLAMPSSSRAHQKRVLDQLERYALRIKVAPSIDHFVNGKLRVQDIRDVELEDLLGRDAVEPDRRLMSHCIAGKIVMVTGAGGSIGSELCRQILRQKPARLILVEMSEFALYTVEQELSALRCSVNQLCEITPFLCSIHDVAKLKVIFATYRVNTVYHAAAYKHVPLVEHNPIAGIQNNVFGTLQLAQAAIAANVDDFVLISTDKAVRPTNVMGASKRLAELILQACARRQDVTRFRMVRFGNVLGSSGSVVPLFRKQILQGGPITLTHPEITRYFMTIPEAAQLVLQAGGMGEGGDVFVLDMGEPVRIADLARRMVHLCGLEVKSESSPKGTIEIHHVGLRPGEKLYEELLIGNNVEKTSHPLIMRAQESELCWNELHPQLEKLDAACAAFDHEQVRAILKELVVGYEPQCGIEDFIFQSEPVAPAPAATHFPGHRVPIAPIDLLNSGAWSGA
jgi:FlaA1/EpsC-like NDP-sugar epimerase